MVDHALALARKSLAVFPLRARSKTPWTSHGCLDATTDPETIAGWWSGWPDSNIGIATGSKSNIWVLDIDGTRRRRAAQARTTLRRSARHGNRRYRRRGHHLYFRLPDFDGAPVIKNTASGLPPRRYPW